MNKVLAVYTNGNCSVTLYNNGRKVRKWSDPHKPRPTFPESVDLKITGMCENTCPMCHENSGSSQRNASKDCLMSLAKRFHYGMEVAIGGGNPALNPSLGVFLKELRKRRVFASMTMHANSLCKSSDLILSWLSKRELWGLGVSLDEEGDAPLDAYPWESLPSRSRLVIHAIAGFHQPWHCIQWLHDYKLLVLGFKHKGRGVEWSAQHEDAIQANLECWRYWIPSLLSRNHPVAFDNLALQQLDIQNRVPKVTWDKHYMGNDGQFSLYIDAVTQEFASSSTSEVRHPFNNYTTMEDMLDAVRSNQND